MLHSWAAFELVDVGPAGSERRDGVAAVGERPRPELRAAIGARRLDRPPQRRLRRQQVRAHGRGQIGAAKLALQPGSEQRLLPRPDDRPVIGVAAEARLHRGRGERGIGDEQADVGHQPGGKRAHDGGDGTVEIGGRGIAEEQREALVGVDDRHRRAVGRERQRGKGERRLAEGGERGRGGHADLGGIGRDRRPRRRVGDRNVEQRRGLGPPYRRHRRRRRERGAVGGRQGGVEQARALHPRDRLERRGQPNRVDVIGETPAPQPFLAVAPLPGQPAALQRHEVRGDGIAGEGLARRDDEARVADHRRRRRAVAEALGQEGRCPRMPVGSVEQVGGGDRRQHERRVDHAVVERRRVALPVTQAAVFEHGEFAQPLLVRRLAVGREPRQHRAQPRLDRLRLQHRQQQPQRHQRVAAEIGVEAPRSGEELLAVAEERQRVARGRVVGGRVVQQLVPGERGQRRIAARRHDAQADAPVRARRDRRAVEPPVGHGQREAVPRRPVGAVAGVGQRVAGRDGRRQHGGGHLAQRLIVAQQADVRQHGLLHAQPRGRKARLGRHPVQRPPLCVGERQRLRRAVEPPRHCCRGRREPQADPAVAGRKGDEDARVGARTQQHVRCHRPVPDEGVEVPPLGQLVAELRRRRRPAQHEQGGRHAGTPRGHAPRPRSGTSAIRRRSARRCRGRRSSPTPRSASGPGAGCLR